MSQILTEDRLISTSFPTLQWRKYIRLLKLNPKKLTYLNAKEIFALSIDDFKTGKLSLDGLANICGYLFHQVIAVSPDLNVKVSELGDILLGVADLSYDIRYGVKQTKYVLEKAYKFREKIK